MIRIRLVIKLSPEEVIKRGVAFFGPAGLGLVVKEQTPDYALLEGGGGYVEMAAQPRIKTTSVEFVAQEWENLVKDFIGTIPHLTGKSLSLNR